MSKIQDRLDAIESNLAAASAAETQQVKLAIQELRDQLEGDGELSTADSEAFDAFEARVMASIGKVFEPEPGDPVNGVRYEMRFASSGSERITQSRVYHDTPEATGEALSALVMTPFVTALDTKVEAGDGKGELHDVTVSGLTNGRETAGKTWSQVPLEALILAQIAANEAERGILQQDLEKVRASNPDPA